MTEGRADVGASFFLEEQELSAVAGFGDGLGAGGEAALFFFDGFGIDEPLAVAGAAGLFLF